MIEWLTDRICPAWPHCHRYRYGKRLCPTLDPKKATLR